ncbi:hypothetical protein [Maritalea myrionectae]|uniref:hypothetical protein n=1 Tax=Maritalea myrionectae TaxID=454601 RepID=UPI00041427FA|nr:hypothetical protein [Maritalea myrionectae]
MNRHQRAEFVKQALTPPRRHVVGELVLDPSGHNRLRLALSGQPYFLEMSQGEALEAIELLRQGVAELTFEEGRDRVVPKPIVKGI